MSIPTKANNPNGNVATAAIYARLSTAEQARGDKTSLHTQEAECRKYAATRSTAVNEQYVVQELHSGEDLWERSQLMRLAEAAERGEFQMLICLNIDRFSRGGPAHFFIIYQRFQDAGVDVRFVREDYGDTGEAETLYAIFAIAAKKENRRRVERMLDAKRARAQQGKLVPGSHAVYGYRYADDKKTRYEMDPISGPIVQCIFAEAAAGKALRRLAQELTDEGIPTPLAFAGIARGIGKRWQPAVLRHLIHQTCYHGEWYSFNTRQRVRTADEKRQRQQQVGKAYRLKVTQELLPHAQRVRLPDDTGPALVTLELATQARQRLALNRKVSRRNTKQPAPVLLAHGLARCGLCGGGMAVIRSYTQPRADGTPTISYRCYRGMKYRGDCSNFGISASLLDDRITRELRRLFTHPESVYTLVKRRLDVEGPAVTGHTRSVEKRLTDVEQQQATLLKQLALFDPDDTAQAAVAKLIREKLTLLVREHADLLDEQRVAQALAEDIERQQAVLDRVAAYADEHRYHAATMTLAERRNALLQLGAVVTVWPRTADGERKITLEFRIKERGMPLPTDAVEVPSPRGLPGVADYRAWRGNVVRLQLRGVTPPADAETRDDWYVPPEDVAPDAVVQRLVDDLTQCRAETATYPSRAPPGVIRNPDRSFSRRDFNRRPYGRSVRPHMDDAITRRPVPRQARRRRPRPGSMCHQHWRSRRQNR